jgi:hypothetical protein
MYPLDYLDHPKHPDWKSMVPVNILFEIEPALMTLLYNTNVKFHKGFRSMKSHVHLHMALMKDHPQPHVYNQINVTTRVETYNNLLPNSLSQHRKHR